MLIVVAPGQGSQTPGMLEPWLEIPEFKAVIDRASVASDIDLIELGTRADAETIKDTAVAQPLIVAAGIASFEAARAGGIDLAAADAFAGHSVGEFTATYCAGVLSIEQAIRAVSIRGRAMATAAALEPTGMVAVMGGERSQVLETLAEHKLIAANENGANQIVAAGPISAIESLLSAAPAGLRLVQLTVAGAFHTQYMNTAQAAVAEVFQSFLPIDAKTQLISNRDGQSITDASEVTTRLISQITSPVRWDLCMQTFAEMGVTGLVELYPGGTLTGLAKRALKGVELFAVKGPSDLPNLREFAVSHLAK